MKFLGVEFAPLNVPLERRLQTLVVAVNFVILIFGGTISICFVLLVFLLNYPWLRFFITFYLIFVFFDRDSHLRGGRSVAQWFRTMKMWDYASNYFPVKLIKTADLEPTRNYIFCSFPHGLLPIGLVCALLTNGANCNQLFPGLEFKLLTFNFHFLIPFFREYILYGSCSNSEESIRYLLSTKPPPDDNSLELSNRGRGIILMVGGASEVFNCQPGSYRVILKRRKGFVKIALQHGAPLVPVYTFGENDYYDQLFTSQDSPVRKLQNLIKQITGIALAVPNGRGLFQYTFGILPRRKPINVVVGAPMELPRIVNPTREEVDEYHAMFTERLIDLFETHKSKYVENHEKVSLIVD